MPTMSIEVLSVCSENFVLSGLSNGIAYSSSFPPESDREPSLWQDHMSQMGGTLIHFYDENRMLEYKRWAYDIVIEENWSIFYFKRDQIRDWECLLHTIVNFSPVKTIWFYSDAQWSNKKKIFKRVQKLSAFLECAVEDGIRMNTAFKICL